MALMNAGLVTLCSNVCGLAVAAANIRSLAAGQAAVRGVHGTAELYDPDDRAQQRPMSQDPAVRAARRQQPRTEQQHAQRTLLSSINDPDNWGLSAGSGGAAYYWLGSSLSSVSSPEYQLPLSLTSPRGNARGGPPAQGFSTANTRPTVQRAVSWRSSMTEPAIFWRSSMADPPHPMHGKGTAAAGRNSPDIEAEH